MPITVALVLAIVAQTSPLNPVTPVTAPAPFYEPKAGDMASLAVQPGAPGGPRSFFLLTAPDEASWGQFLTLNRSRVPRPRYEAMAAAGQLFSESPDTKVRVIAPRPASAVRVGGSAFYPVEIQILEGPRKGQRGCISHRYLTPSPARPVAAGVGNPGGRLSPRGDSTPGPGSPAATTPPNSYHEWQQQYAAETRQRQQNDQAMQDVLNKIRQAQESQLSQSGIMQHGSHTGVRYDQNGVIIVP